MGNKISKQKLVRIVKESRVLISKSNFTTFLVIGKTIIYKQDNGIGILLLFVRSYLLDRFCIMGVERFVGLSFMYTGLSWVQLNRILPQQFG